MPPKCKAKKKKREREFTFGKLINSRKHLERSFKKNN